MLRTMNKIHHQERNFIMGERKYEKLVYQFKPEYNEAAAEGVGTDFVYSPQAYFRGASQIINTGSYSHPLLVP